MKETTILTRLAVSCLCFLLLLPGVLPAQPPEPPKNPPITENGENPIQPLGDEKPIEELK